MWRTWLKVSCFFFFRFYQEWNKLLLSLCYCCSVAACCWHWHYYHCYCYCHCHCHCCCHCYHYSCLCCCRNCCCCFRFRYWTWVVGCLEVEGRGDPIYWLCIGLIIKAKGTLFCTLHTCWLAVEELTLVPEPWCVKKNNQNMCHDL